MTTGSFRLSERHFPQIDVFGGNSSTKFDRNAVEFGAQFSIHFCRKSKASCFQVFSYGNNRTAIAVQFKTTGPLA